MENKVHPPAQSPQQLPPAPAPNGPQTGNWCSFHCVLVLFEDLMNLVIKGIVWTIDKPFHYISTASEYLIDLAHDIRVIASRCLFAPEFDPYSPRFLEQLDELSAQAETLGERLRKIEVAFPPRVETLKVLKQIIEYNTELTTARARASRYESATRWRADLAQLHRDRTLPLKRRLDDIVSHFSGTMRWHQDSILMKFESTLEKLCKYEAVIPRDFTKGFREMHSTLNIAYNEGIFNNFDWQQYKSEHLEQQIRALENGPDVVRGPDEHAPPRLRNLGVSCYMNSATQAILCIDEIRTLLATPLERKTKEKSGVPKLESERKYKRREAIRQQLLYLTQHRTDQTRTATLSHLDVIELLSESNNPLEKIGEETDISKPGCVNGVESLRNAIFFPRRQGRSLVNETKERGREFRWENRGVQLDAASIIELYMDALLPYRFKHEVVLKTELFPGIEFVKKPSEEVLTTQQIPLKTNSFVEWKEKLVAEGVIDDTVDDAILREQHRQYLREPIQLNSALRSLFQEHVHTGGRDFNPNCTMEHDLVEARVVDEQLAEQSKTLRPLNILERIREVEHNPDLMDYDAAMLQRLCESENNPKLLHYTEQCFLRELPDVLPLHLKRFGIGTSVFGHSEGRKIDVDVILPEDGIVDLTEFQSRGEGEPQPALYRIVSYIEHSGGLHGGHYIAHVQKEDGRYWRCSDRNVGEITRQTFLNNRQAYILMLKRLTPDEVAAHQASLIPDE